MVPPQNPGENNEKNRVECTESLSNFQQKQDLDQGDEDEDGEQTKPHHSLSLASSQSLSISLSGVSLRLLCDAARRLSTY